VAGAVGVHHAVAGHHALLGKLGIATGRVAVAGARLKLVVAAVSMAAVGGFGVAAGPIIDRLSPSPNADRGIAVGPALLSSERSTGGSTRSAAGSFDPRMRAELRGPAPRTDRTPVDPVHGTTAGVPTTDTAVRPAADPGGSSTSGSGTSVSGSSDVMTVQLQKPVAAPTTTDPVALTTTPTGRQPDISPTSTPAGRPTPYGSTWTTSWTSNGTTVWEWSWTNGPD
jgi:hypothetical protein